MTPPTLVVWPARYVAFARPARAGAPRGWVCLSGGTRGAEPPVGALVVPGGGQRGSDPSVRMPDLLWQAVELGEMLLAVAHLRYPSLGVDAEDLGEIRRGDRHAVQVEFLDGRDDAHGRLDALHLAVLELQQPQQRTEVVAIAGPQEVTVVRIALEPVDVGKDRLHGGCADDAEPVLRVCALGVGHERAHRHRVVPQLTVHSLGRERCLRAKRESVVDALGEISDRADQRL